MNNSNYDNLDGYNLAHSDNTLSSAVAERLRNAISSADLHTESKASTTLAHGEGYNPQASSKDALLIPHVQIGERGEMLFCSTPAKDAVPVKDSAETREQRMDQKIKDCFGADVFDHLKDWNWLIENQKKLADGFKKVNNQDDKWDMATRMRELSVVDGKPLIFTSKVEGQTRGNLIPKRHDVYLRRGSFRSDDYIGQVYR